MSAHRGTCFCGAVEIEASGEPITMGYCHCSSCRSWSGAPVSAVSLWSEQVVRVTRGAEEVGTYAKTELSHRKFCRACGGHFMVHIPQAKMMDILPATFPDLKFVPKLHVNYAETVLPIRDGLPKLKDFGPAFGGSGELVPE